MGTTIEKLQNFSKYVPRQDITNFIAKYEIFKKIINIQGSIIECGIFLGGGLMTFAQLSSIFEPVNHQRKIIGFDTFSGFPELHKSDKKSISQHMHKGGLGVNSYDDLQKCIALFNSNRFLSHIPKIELIKGNATVTIPKFLKDNPHIVVSLLYLDFDIYKPTKVAIENFVPRMPKGSVIVFDELNS
ncbi:MAG: class I SAM-dependent methyltransferase, partial [Patescibacteria group bacterium]|nr:class I SAM-dependent methyltransferase [Patescibacteria group bacterium]